MASNPNLPFDATLNPEGYKAGTVDEMRAKTFWSQPENIKKSNNPFPNIKPAKPAISGNTKDIIKSAVDKTNKKTKKDSAPVTVPVDLAGNPVDGDVYVGGKKTTIADEYSHAFSNVSYLGKIKEKLIAAGQLRPTDKSRQTILNKYQEILISASSGLVANSATDPNSKYDVDQTLKDYQTSGFGVSAGVDKTPTATISSPESAKASFNAEFQTMFSENAPKDIMADYQKELKDLEMSRTSKTKKVNGVKVGTYGVSQAERDALTRKYITKAAQMKITAAASGDPKAIGSLSKGAFGVTMLNLRNAYSENGIPINEKILGQQTLAASKDKNAFDSTISLINSQAGLYYPALADKIGKGHTVKQLLTPYISSRANILEEDPDTMDISKFKDVASSGTDKKSLMSLYDYEISLRKDPKWNYTKNAQDSLSKVARGLAETFGLMG